MIDPLTLSGLVVASGGLASLGAWALRRPGLTLTWRELRFPRDLAAVQVQALLDVVAGLAHGPVVLLIESDAAHVRFLLGASVSSLGAIRQAVSGIAPQLRLDAVDALGSDGFVASGRVVWSGRWPLLRRDAPELAVAGLLGTLTGIGTNERVRLAVRLAPAGRVRPPATPPRRPGVDARDVLPPGHERAVSAKLAEPLLRVSLTLAATATVEARARQLMQRVVAVLRTRSGLRGTLRVRWLGHATTVKTLAAERRRPGDRWNTLLTSAEAVGLIGWPVGAPPVPGISYGVGPRLLPPRDLPVNGRVFGVSTWPSQQHRPLAQPVVGALQHTAIVGGTGSGKSTLIASLVEQDMTAGRGCLVVDVKGDLIADLLARIPERRHRDVILLDPATGGPQPGLRLFPPGQDGELTTDVVIGTLREIWPDTFGVRSAQYLRMGLNALASTPGSTLVDLPFLFTDPAFRRRVLRRVGDPLLLAGWQRFEGLSVADQAVQIASPLSKLEELTSRSRLRAVLGQSQPRLALGEVLARGRIVLVRLPPGLLGQPATRLLSALVLWQFFAAVEARAALPANKRPVFNVYVDEVAALRSVGLPLGDLLERARGLGVGLLLAPQALSRLSSRLQHILLANVGSLVAFRLSAGEAKLVAAELPGVTAEQLQHLGRFEVAMKLALRPGDVTSTMTATTPALSQASSDPDHVRDIAATNWGQTIEDVDAALAERLNLTTPTAAAEIAGAEDDEETTQAVGARRRSS